MRVGVRVQLCMVTAIALMGFATCSDPTGEEASTTGAGNTAADSDLAGTVSALTARAAPPS